MRRNVMCTEGLPKLKTERKARVTANTVNTKQVVTVKIMAERRWHD